MAHGSIVNVTVILIATFLLFLSFLMYRHRSHINKLRKQGFPMPQGWSWIFGHSLVVLKYTRKLPPSAKVLLAMKDLCTEFAETEMFLMDMWPGYPTSLIVFNPESLHLISNKWNLLKPQQSLEAIKPIVGGPNIVSMNGDDWKFWRSLLNPGFSVSNLNNYVPFIVDCVQIFCEKMRASANNGVISLDEYATRLTFDVIVKVTLGSYVDYQRNDHVLPRAFDAITKWHSFWDIRVLLNPLRPFMQWRHGNAIKKYVRNEIYKRYSEISEEKKQGTRKMKSVISLALDGYEAEKSSGSSDIPAVLDGSFVETLINQVRLFLFAGNDTTSSTIAFCFHTIAKYSAIREKIRQEHNTMFGANDPAIMLKTPTSSINALTQLRSSKKPYACTLNSRYQPAANMRRGQFGKRLTALNGQVLETEGFNIIVVHQALHENRRIWARPQECLPERWLVGPDHELYPPTNGYRPFDVGSRTCIGQPLAMTEIKIVLLLAARSFDIAPAYEEFDRLDIRRPWGTIREWFKGKEIKHVYGDRAYQSEKAGTHPSDGYPCRISLA